MVIFTTICLESLYKLGKEFKWKKPERCPICGKTLHGHGFCIAYFDGYAKFFYIKRYRCPHCRLVIRMRPDGHLKYFRSNIDKIYKSLKYRLSNRKWPPWCSRQKGGHWLRRFISRLKFAKGYVDINPLEALEEYFKGGLSFSN